MANTRLTNGRKHDSDDDSDSSSSDSEDSTVSITNATTNNNPSVQNTTATPTTRGKKRGRPKKQVVLDDSDDSNDTVTNGPTNNQKQTARKATGTPAQRGKARGRPAKRQRVVLDDSSDDEPQPSTSGMNNTNGNQGKSSQEDSEDSTSESQDSDYMPIDDSRKDKRKRLPPARTSPRKKTAKNGNAQKKHQGPKQLSTSLQNGSSQKKTQGVSQISKSLNYGRPSQGSKGEAFDSKLVESLAQKCVYFLLIEDQKKYAIKRKAIVQHVFKDETYSPKLYGVVMVRTNAILMKTFGMELMELENQKDNYLIINVLKRELGVVDYVELSKTKHQQHGLILYLLTVIFMNGNCITEEDLQKALKTLGIDLTSKKNHPIFGDVKKFITVELVKQMYLSYECISKDPPQYEIMWGLRAKQEFDKKDLLGFACEVLDETTPENWIMQYKDAEESATPP